MLRVLLFSVLLVFSTACATTSEKIPSIRAEGHWKFTNDREPFAEFRPGAALEPFAVDTMRHRARHQIRRKRHFHSTEHRWLLTVSFESRDRDAARRLAEVEVVAVTPDGKELTLARTGVPGTGTVRFEGTLSDGERSRPLPVAYLVGGARVDVPAD